MHRLINNAKGGIDIYLCYICHGDNFTDLGGSQKIIRHDE